MERDQANFVKVLELRVAFADTDGMMVAWHGNYLRWFEIARTEMLREDGFSYKSLVDRGLHLPVTEAVVRYHRPARFDDLLELYAGVVSVRGIRLRIGYRIEVGGVVLATGHTDHAFVDESGRPVRPPREVLEKFASLAETGKEGA